MVCALVVLRLAFILPSIHPSNYLCLYVCFSRALSSAPEFPCRLPVCRFRECVNPQSSYYVRSLKFCWPANDHRTARHLAPKSTCFLINFSLRLLIERTSIQLWNNNSLNSDDKTISKFIMKRRSTTDNIVFNIRSCWTSNGKINLSLCTKSDVTCNVLLSMNWHQ
jgi:hypothetical protein